MHWRNSKFQIVAFLGGACHTPDEAYRKLKELREERHVAIEASKAEILRTAAKLIKANRLLSSDDPAERLEAQADIVEHEAFEEQSKACFDEAVRERDFIDELIKRVEPHRKYKDLPDHEAHQLAQSEEWFYELKFRAENFLATQGVIPHDQFATMRMHPLFEEKLYPYILELNQAIKSGQMIDFKISNPLALL